MAKDQVNVDTPAKVKIRDEFVTEPAIIIIWDPEIVTDDEYAHLVNAIGDAVRSHGGLGVKLLREDHFGVFVEEGAIL